jgi:hypothetical protein
VYQRALDQALVVADRRIADLVENCRELDHGARRTLELLVVGPHGAVWADSSAVAVAIDCCHGRPLDSPWPSNR